MRLFLIFIIIVFTFGCEPLPCINPAAATLNIRWVVDSSGIEKVKKLYFDSLVIKQGKSRWPQTKKDSLSSLSSLSLPVPFAKPFFWIVFSDSIFRDSIRFTYQSMPVFISEECGYQYYYTMQIDSTGGTKFKNIVVTKNSLDSSKATNVKITL